jgi:hypothetical protein
MNRFVASILCLMLPVVCVAEAKKDKPSQEDVAPSYSRQVLPPVERSEERAVLDAIPTPPIFQNPFMAPEQL